MRLWDSYTPTSAKNREHWVDRLKGKGGKVSE